MGSMMYFALCLKNVGWAGLAECLDLSRRGRIPSFLPTRGTTLANKSHLASESQFPNFNVLGHRGLFKNRSPYLLGPSGCQADAKPFIGTTSSSLPCSGYQPHFTDQELRARGVRFLTTVGRRRRWGPGGQPYCGGHSPGPMWAVSVYENP